MSLKRQKNVLKSSAKKKSWLFWKKENGLSPQEKLARRREDIKPGYDAFKELVETQRKNVLTKGAIGRAFHYAVYQLPLIYPFFEDGRIHIDNNAIENKIRPQALGRKNFLFAGSNEGTVY
jgi:hypothetical protein